MRRTKEDAEESKKAIIEAAYKVFLRKGYAATNMLDIAKEIGMTRGVIYWHFENKTDLFFALLNEGIEESLAASNIIFQSNDSLQNKLKKLLERDSVGSRITELLKSFQPGSVDFDSKSREKASKKILMKIQSAFDSFVEFISNEQKSGNLRKDIDVQAFGSTFMMLSGVLNLPSNNQDTMPMMAVRNEKRKEIIDFFWNGLNSAFIEKVENI